MYVLGNLRRYYAMPINLAIFIAHLDMGVTLRVISGSFLFSVIAMVQGMVSKGRGTCGPRHEVVQTWSYYIYPWKVFLILILDVEFKLSNVDVCVSCFDPKFS